MARRFPTRTEEVEIFDEDNQEQIENNSYVESIETFTDVTDHHTSRTSGISWISVVAEEPSTSNAEESEMQILDPSMYGSILNNHNNKRKCYRNRI